MIEFEELTLATGANRLATLSQHSPVPSLTPAAVLSSDDLGMGSIAAAHGMAEKPMFVPVYLEKSCVIVACAEHKTSKGVFSWNPGCFWDVLHMTLLTRRD